MGVWAWHFMDIISIVFIDYKLLSEHGTIHIIFLFVPHWTNCFEYTTNFQTQLRNLKILLTKQLCICAQMQSCLVIVIIDHWILIGGHGLCRPLVLVLVPLNIFPLRL